jgi:hypothetical protein
MKQGHFLKRMGIDVRLSQLLSQLKNRPDSESAIAWLMRGYNRLEEISNAYQVLVGYKMPDGREIKSLF